MQKFMRVCPICAKENIRKESHSKIYVAGWNAGFLEEPDNEETCLKHENQKLIKMSMTCEEFQILRNISNEPSFMQAMNDLKERDIIEYYPNLRHKLNNSKVINYKMTIHPNAQHAILQISKKFPDYPKPVL